MKECKTRIYLEEHNKSFYLAKICRVIGLILIGVSIGLIWGANAYADVEQAREQRYTVYDDIVAPIQFFDGKRQLEDLEILQLVAYTMYKLPHIVKNEHLAQLMLETARVESNSGKFNYKGRNAYGKGIWQVEIDTAKCTLDWLKFRHNDVYLSVMSLYDKKQNLAYNLEFNAPFNCALALTKYWRVAPVELTNLGYLEDRANLWLNKYVTHNRNRQDLLYLTRNL